MQGQILEAQQQQLGEAGVIPRVASAVFAALARRSAEAPDYTSSVKVQYLELYNEELRDLLAAPAPADADGKPAAAPPAPRD